MAKFSLSVGMVPHGENAAMRSISRYFDVETPQELVDAVTRWRDEVLPHLFTDWTADADQERIEHGEAISAASLTAQVHSPQYEALRAQRESNRFIGKGHGRLRSRR